jgi:predicted RNA binding protein YcfA (HicA-like mRNA interferase family)
LPDRKLVPVPYQTLVRIFEKEGFTFARQEGDHKIFTKPGVLRPLVIPAYRAVPVFIIRNLLRTSGVSRERYFELMEG